MATDIWTVKAALDWCCGYLERKGDDHARLSAQWLLSHATGLSRIEVYTHFDQPLPPSERDILRDGVRRRGMGEPLQYITATAPFRHLDIHVEPGVLIPRPETEMLVEYAIKALGARSEGAFRAADICTGSGCIACAIADEHPQCTVAATDISPDAVRIARGNAERLGLDGRIDVFQADLLSGVAGPFDLIISNPPYIPTSVMAQLPDEVSAYEPHLALDGGEDGLGLFRVLAVQAASLLAPGGVFACELHETCLDEAAHEVRALGYGSVCVESDLAGRKRILTACAPVSV